MPRYDISYECPHCGILFDDTNEDTDHDRCPLCGAAGDEVAVPDLYDEGETDEWFD